MKFKSLMTVALGLTLGFASCSSDDKAEDNSVVTKDPKNVTLHINTRTYAAEASADGKTPVVNDAQVFFIGNGTILAKGAMLPAEITTGKKFLDVPGAATEVVFVGNSTALTSPLMTTAVVGMTKANLLKLMFEQDKQTDPENAVNVFGSKAITTAAGVQTAAVTITAATARIELEKVEVLPAATIPLTNFKLDAIYINNTYTKLGMDGVTVPVAAGEILNYGKTHANWTGVYPARFTDAIAAGTAATSFSPAAGTKWGYYVMAPIANTATVFTGTIIDAVQQSATPHVVLKIKDATAVGQVIPATTYVTVKNFKDAGGAVITHFLPGKVYQISSIAIGGEHLTTSPEVDAKVDITVTVTVTPWTNTPAKPDI